LLAYAHSGRKGGRKVAIELQQFMHILEGKEARRRGDKEVQQQFMHILADREAKGRGDYDLQRFLHVLAGREARSRGDSKILGILVGKRKVLWCVLVEK
jgi:hypothetical protein